MNFISSNYLLFKSKLGCTYLYDTSTSTIHPWFQNISSKFTDILYSTKDEDLDTLNFPDMESQEEFIFYIKLWRAKTGAFRMTAPFSSPCFNKLSDVPFEKRGLIWFSDLALNVSEACNLRCAYCSFSSHYDGYRTHSERLMSWGTAKKAIDWIYKYNENPIFYAFPDRNVNIVFYGGEPLLNFDVVKKSIIYAREKKQDHYGLVISISTNLTLLSDEHLAFLHEHDISLNVSLDGPPEEHNRYRTFKDGRTTYEKAIKKLQKIRDFDEEYYFSRIRILPTIDGNSKVSSIYKYFEDNKNELPPFLMINLLKDLSSCNFHKLNPYNEEAFHKEIKSVLDIYFDKKIGGEKYIKGDFLYHFIEESLDNTFQRIHAWGKSLPVWFTGTCLPGRKIFVSIDGAFHICERINEYFPFGSVEDGIDEAKILSIMNNYFNKLTGCHKCWARNLCTICYAAVCEYDDYDFEKRCISMRTVVEENLKLLFSILEKRPDAFISKDPIINPTLESTSKSLSHNEKI